MTENLLNSVDKELEKTPNQKMIEVQEQRLRDKGIEAANLVVAYATGSDIFLGEAISLEAGIGGFLMLRNPKRIFRLVKMTQAGLEVQMFVGDVELLDKESFIEVVPVARYIVKLQPESTKIALYTLLLEHFEAKIMQSAQKLGIVAPR